MFHNIVPWLAIVEARYTVIAASERLKFSLLIASVVLQSWWGCNLLYSLGGRIASAT